MSRLKYWLIGSALLLGTPTLAQSTTTYDLTFNPQNYRSVTTDVNGRALRYRAYERVVYVRRPQDTTYQSMNIYIPEEYFEGGSIGTYNASSAPIFFPNQIGGYMQAEPGTPGLQQQRGAQSPAAAAGTTTPPSTGTATAAASGATTQPTASAPAQPATSATAQGSPNAILVALSRGYVVASPGARGRTTRNAAGEYIGKAPAAILDLKAAVRYLRYNDAAMPGNAERIVSNGTSAGGALSALLGATGNNLNFEPYLTAMGAADTRDDIYAVSSYCPITDLEHADAAYEWQFNGVNDYQRLQISRDVDYNVQRTLVPGTLTAEEVALSNGLKPLFSPYLNSLRLRQGDQPLTLDANGNGPFKAYMESFLQASAQSALDAGQDLSNLTWLTVSNGRVTGVDFDAYARAAGRAKVPPAFDGLSLENAENELFGSATVNARHFTAFSQERTRVEGTTADAQAIRLMNPMNYIGLEGTQTASHWRIRVGTADRDTSLAVSAILATRLTNTGHDVDYFQPWNVPHSGDYDLDQLFAWMDKVVAQ